MWGILASSNNLLKPLPKLRGGSIILASVAALLLSAPVAFGASVILSPSADNTMAQDFPGNSSGACDSIFAGMTDNNVARRALLQFDIAGSVPAGSIINSVTLTMAITRGSNHPPAAMTLHWVNTAWGEGVNGCGARGDGQGKPAVSGAATWNDAMATVTDWSSAGGDYDPTASATAQVVDTVPVWDSTLAGNWAMAADVQGWLDNPAINYGWLLPDRRQRRHARPRQRLWPAQGRVRDRAGDTGQDLQP